MGYRARCGMSENTKCCGGDCDGHAVKPCKVCGRTDHTGCVLWGHHVNWLCATCKAAEDEKALAACKAMASGFDEITRAAMGCRDVCRTALKEMPRTCPKCGDEMQYGDKLVDGDPDSLRTKTYPAGWACPCGHTERE